MKGRSTTVLLLATALTLVFGFFSVISIADHMNMGRCPVSVATGGNCPPVSGDISQTLHHIAGMKSMSTGVLGSASVLLAVVLLAFFLIPRIRSLPISHVRYRTVRNKIFSPERHSLFWSALHNKFGGIVSVWVQGMVFA